MNSRAKGKRGELEVVAVAKAAGFPDAARTSDGRAQDQRGDISGVPLLHLEVKRVQRFDIEAWMDQARSDRPPGTIATVVHRRNDMPWLATMDFDALLGLVLRYELYRVAREGGVRRSGGFS